MGKKVNIPYGGKPRTLTGHFEKRVDFQKLEPAVLRRIFGSPDVHDPILVNILKMDKKPLSLESLLKLIKEQRKEIDELKEEVEKLKLALRIISCK